MTCTRVRLFIRAFGLKEKSCSIEKYMELIEDYSGVTTRSPSLRSISATMRHSAPVENEHNTNSSNANKSLKKWCPDEDSWTSVDRQELDHAVRHAWLILPF